jgi:hypothetical protein
VPARFGETLSHNFIVVLMSRATKQVSNHFGIRKEMIFHHRAQSKTSHVPPT